MKGRTDIDFIHLYAWAVTGACVLYVFSVTFIPISQHNQRYADLIIGAMIGIFTTLVSFHFGDSRKTAPPPGKSITETKQVTESP